MRQEFGSRASKYARVVDRIDKLRDGTPNDAIIRLGYPSIDKLIGGGVHVGDLVLLAGDAGSGTSSLAMGFAIRSAALQSAEDVAGALTADDPPVHAARVLFLTGEFTLDRAHARLLGIAARVTSAAMRTGDVDDISRARLAATAVELRDRGPTIEHLGEGSDALDALLERMRSVQLVIIDGVESMLRTGTVIRGTRDDTIAEQLLALKRLAIAHEVAIVAVTHLSAVAPGRRPRLDDLPAAPVACAHADIILGVFREELYQQDLGISGAAEVLLLKHREMPCAYADLYFDAVTLRFEDMLDAE